VLIHEINYNLRIPLNMYKHKENSMGLMISMMGFNQLNVSNNFRNNYSLADGLIVLITSTYRGLSLTNVLEISRLP
jgi:hypothetical protein